MRGQKIQWEGWRDEIIRRDYEHVTREELARRVGVSVRSVTRRARELGFSAKPLSEMLKDESFRKAVSTNVVRGQARHHGTIRRHFIEHPEAGRDTQFSVNHKVSEDTKRKAASAIRAVVYDELVRMKYGLPRRTRMRLKKRMNIDRNRYFPEGDNEKQDK